MFCKNVYTDLDRSPVSHDIFSGTIRKRSSILLLLSGLYGSAARARRFQRELETLALYSEGDRPNDLLIQMYSGKSARRILDSFGLVASFGERIGSEDPQVIPMTGSFHATPRSYSGR